MAIYKLVTQSVSRSAAGDGGVMGGGGGGGLGGGAWGAGVGRGGGVRSISVQDGSTLGDAVHVSFHLLTSTALSLLAVSRLSLPSSLGKQPLVSPLCSVLQP